MRKQEGVNTVINDKPVSFRFGKEFNLALVDQSAKMRGVSRSRLFRDAVEVYIDIDPVYIYQARKMALEQNKTPGQIVNDLLGTIMAP